MKDLTSQAGEATNTGEQGQVYKITKLVSSKYRRDADTPIVDSRKATHHRSRAGAKMGRAFQRNF